MKQFDEEIIRKALEEKAKAPKKLIKLHYLPDAIKASIKDLKEMSEDDSMRNLFEDIAVLVDWALARLPIVAPEKKEEESAEC